jgi:hypothetical protein
MLKKRGYYNIKMGERRERGGREEGERRERGGRKEKERRE